MCSCGKKKGTTQNFTHTFKDETGTTQQKTYSSEMDARQAASRLGGTVRAAA
jgi:hypothetical protein